MDEPNKDKQKKIKIAVSVCAAVVICVLICVFAFEKASTHSQQNVSDISTSQTQTSQTTQTTQTTQTMQTTQTTQTTAPTTQTTTESAEFDSEDVLYTTDEWTTIRKSASSDSKSLGKVGRNTYLPVVSQKGSWVEVVYKSTTGYVKASQLTDKTPKIKYSSPYLIKVNRTQNIVIVYEKDSNGKYTVAKKAMVCSVGTGNNTPRGIFYTSDRYNWRLLEGNVYGQYATRITAHILFHSVPYYTQDKSDLEYDEYNKLGEAASLGCVRLSAEDSKWIKDNCPSGTTVIIYDSDEKEPLDKPTPIRIDTDDSRRGWDPTDPDKNNPWNN